MSSVNVTRIVCIASASIVVIAGLASRRLGGVLPTFVSAYAGDTLWALMVFLLVSALAVRAGFGLRIAISLVVCYLVELSQLYHAPWIDAVRRTRLGGLVLGFGFLWSDLACYTVGVALGGALEALTRRRLGRFRKK